MLDHADQHTDITDYTFLFLQSCNVLQHKPDFVSCIWGGLLFQVHTQAYSVCSVYAVHVQYASGAEATLTVFSHRSLQLICGCLPQTHLSIILISNPNIFTEYAFSIIIISPSLDKDWDGALHVVPNLSQQACHHYQLMKIYCHTVKLIL